MKQYKNFIITEGEAADIVAEAKARRLKAEEEARNAHTINAYKARQGLSKLELTPRQAITKSITILSRRDENQKATDREAAAEILELALSTLDFYAPINPAGSINTAWMMGQIEFLKGYEAEQVRRLEHECYSPDFHAKMANSYRRQRLSHERIVNEHPYFATVRQHCEEGESESVPVLYTSLY